MVAIEDNSQRVGPDRCLAQCSRRKGTWGGGPIMICTMVEVARDMPYRLLWQGLLSREATVNSGRWYGI